MSFEHRDVTRVAAYDVDAGQAASSHQQPVSHAAILAAMRQVPKVLSQTQRTMWYVCIAA